MGAEFSFVKNSIDAAIEFGEKSPEWNITVPEKDKDAALNRVRHHLNSFQNAKILWVDDHPENNRNERRMFRKLRADIDTATNSEKALDRLSIDIYDLVISDIGRDDERDLDGLQFLDKFRAFDKKTPLIFYIGVVDPDKDKPAQAFGITKRPDELLHLTLDALETKKY